MILTKTQNQKAKIKISVITESHLPKTLAVVSKSKIQLISNFVFNFLKLKNFKNCSLNIVLCNDEFIQRLNKNYRKKDKPTNVLSFPYIEFSEKKVFQNDLIGEVFISLETLQMEALEQSKKLPDHFSHLLVHSILHILGYDHEFDKDANKMENLEIKILKEFGIKNPYNY